MIKGIAYLAIGLGLLCLDVWLFVNWYIALTEMRVILMAIIGLLCIAFIWAFIDTIPEDKI